MPESLTEENVVNMFLVGGDFIDIVSIPSSVCECSDWEECSYCYGGLRDYEEETIEHYISWPTISKIYARIVAHYTENKIETR